uniref:Pseudouridine-5'-phosphate glycosidase n=1 Tax=Araucaria cunninghamii TaxID=56994 RepID=A0A0D6R6I9_ARACU
MERVASRLANIHSHLSHSPGVIDKLDEWNIKVAPLVRRALVEGLPIVALESTIISHGMPYPENLETAKEVERIVKENGAVPATIAILNGVPHIGLTTLELEELSKMGPRALKTSRRDIASVVAMGAYGATTVSATMFFAAKAGIRIFVTGGIGGVHRHGENTMDVSSDLMELGRTPVAVISAGVKSILDIPRTLEYLETQGVTVAAYGTEEFPAFFTQKSGCKVNCRMNSPEECAKLIDASIKLGLGSGILFGIPIPETSAAAGDFVESAIQTALRETVTENITGSAVTPFVLMRVSELTGGASLAANVALIKNNALVGAKISAALRKLQDS